MSSIILRVKGDKLPSPLYIRFRNGRKLDLQSTTPILLNPKHWDNAKGTYKNSKDVPNLTKKVAQLNKLKNFVLERYMRDLEQGLFFDNRWLKEAVEDFLNRPKGELTNEIVTDHKRYLTDLWERYLTKDILEERNSSGLAYDEPTIDQFRTFLTRWEHFEKFKAKGKDKKIPIHRIDKQLIYEYLDWMKDPNTGPTGFIGSSTRKKSVSHVLKKLEYARDAYKLRVNGDVLKDGAIKFPADTVFEAEDPALTEEDLNAMRKVKFDLSNPKEKFECEVRDTFVAHCYSGLRISDYGKGSPYNPETDDKMYITITKTRAPMRLTPPQIVKDLYRKYNNDVPTFITKNERDAFAYALKKVAKKAGLDTLVEKLKKKKGHEPSIVQVPLWQRVAPHTSRRTFATYLYTHREEFNMDIEDIMVLGGWKNKDTFMKYVKGREQRAAEKYSEAMKIAHKSA